MLLEELVDDQVAKIAEEQIRIRRHLHAHPEPSGDEVETSRFVCRRLLEAGLSPSPCRSEQDVETGVFVDMNLGSPAADAPLIAIRCDLDALRLADGKTVEYRSRNPGVTHACGHDAHTSMVLGAALASTRLNEARESSAGGVRLRMIFQPAEETCQGARWMVAQGAMEGVAAVLGIHVDPEKTVGRAAIRTGPLTANCDEVEIIVEGRGGHAARPHHTVDPIAAAAHLVSTLYEFLPRRVDSRHPAVLTVGKISGGSAPNVIPESVELLGTLRTTARQSRETMKIEIDRICSAAELSTGARIRRRFHNPLASVVNAAAAADAFRHAAGAVLGKDRVEEIPLPSMGGEDFSVYLEHAPGAMLRLGSGTPDQPAPFLHSPLFDIDERALALGTRILLRTAIQLAKTLETQ